MGLKLAKQILSNPETANHGETLAMKGLILNCLGKKDEAYEYVRKGLRNDLTSHVCWHVYGLLQRSEHKYDEAIKCYRNALKYDKDNITILRDLSLLQIQMRDLEGFRDTRYQLFMLRSAQRVSWLSFAVAYHLLNDYSTAANILNELRATQKQQKEQNSTDDNSDKKYPQPIDYEQSELLLYQVMILFEAASYNEALDFLNKHSSQICDRLSVLEYKAQLLLALGRNNEAVKLIQDQLIARNQENYLYYQQLEQALNIDPNDENSRLILYQQLQQKYPRSQVPFKIPLNFVSNPEKFKPLVDAYLKKFIQRCLPALFRNLRPVYNYEYDRLVTKLNEEYIKQHHQQEQNSSSKSTDSKDIKFIWSSSKSSETRKTRASVFQRHSIPSKIKIIEDLLLSYEKNLNEKMCFDDGGDGATTTTTTANPENKTLVLWVYFYLAQHYDYLGYYEKALEYVKLAMDHTPTLIELLTLKGKIYKHMGEVDKAVEQVNEAQRLDTADRYLNSKCAKYLLRADKIPQAQEMCSKFTRAGVSVTDNLNEMQCMWFLIESANAHHRMKEYGLALKKCYEIDAFFSEVTEDQFDFHTYCMRKMTLRSYIRLLRVEDVLRSHRFYFDAAELAINIYLKLYDEPLAEGKENQDTSAKNDQLSASELKKIKSKERKAAAKQQQQQQQQHQQHNHHSKSSKNSNSKQQNNDADSDSRQGGKMNAKDANSKSNSNNNNNRNETQNNSNNTKATTATEPHHVDTISSASALDTKLLEHPKDPLERAIRFLTPLKTLATKRIETHLLAFEVYWRKNKILLMLQSVKRAHKLDSYNSSLRQQLQRFLERVSKLKEGGELLEPIRKVLDIEIEKLQCF